MHPAIFMTFDLIACGTILGFASTKLEFITSFSHPYTCNGPGCPVETVRTVEYIGCAIALVDA